MVTFNEDNIHWGQFPDTTHQAGRISFADEGEKVLVLCGGKAVFDSQQMFLCLAIKIFCYLCGTV